MGHDDFLSSDERFTDAKGSLISEAVRFVSVGKKGRGRNKKNAPGLGFTPVIKRKGSRTTANSSPVCGNQFNKLCETNACILSVGSNVIGYEDSFLECHLEIMSDMSEKK